MDRPCRDDHAAIVVGKALHDMVDVRLVMVSLNYGGLQIVRNDYLGRSSNRLETFVDGVYEVVYSLAGHGKCESVIRGWKT